MNRVSLQTGAKIIFSPMGTNPYYSIYERENKMPDYAACSNEKCPLRFKCVRFLMVYGERQSVMEYKYDKENGCDGFWDSKNGASFKYKRVVKSKSEEKRLKAQGAAVILNDDERICSSCNTLKPEHAEITESSCRCIK